MPGRKRGPTPEGERSENEPRQGKRSGWRAERRHVSGERTRALTGLDGQPLGAPSLSFISRPQKQKCGAAGGSTPFFSRHLRTHELRRNEGHHHGKAPPASRFDSAKPASAAGVTCPACGGCAAKNAGQSALPCLSRQRRGLLPTQLRAWCRKMYASGSTRFARRARPASRSMRPRHRWRRSKGRRRVQGLERGGGRLA